MGAEGEVVVLLASWIVTTTLCFALVIADERRLDPERLARAWPRTTRDLVLVWLGPLAVPFHFARTRGHLRSVRGVVGLLFGTALGLVAAALVVAASTACVSLLAWALGIPD